MQFVNIAINRDLMKRVLNNEISLVEAGAIQRHREIHG